MEKKNAPIFFSGVPPNVAVFVVVLCVFSLSGFFFSPRPISKKLFVDFIPFRAVKGFFGVIFFCREKYKKHN